MRLLVLFLALVVFAGCERHTDYITVKGRVHAADGQPLKMAHVRVTTPDAIYKHATGAAVHGSGQFELKVPYQATLMVRVSAVDHEPLFFPLLPKKKGHAIDLDIHLAPYSLRDDLSDIAVIGDWNDFKLASASPMVKTDDGRYHYVLHADTPEVKCQIVNATRSGRTINSAGQNFRPDSTGDYYSVIALKDGRADITFDPAWFHAHRREPLVSSPTDDDIEKYTRFERRLITFKRNLYSRMMAWRAKHGNYDGFQDGLDSLFDEWRHHKADTASLMYRFMAVRISDLPIFLFGKENTREIIEAVPYDDALWEYTPYVLGGLYNNVDPALRDSLFVWRDRMKAPRAAGYILAFEGLRAQRKGDKERVVLCYNELKKRYPDSKTFKFYLDKLNPAKKIAVGNPVPDFEVKLLHSEKTVSRQSMLGRYYLMDFWAVWCGPCRGEMPNLHKAWETYKDKNFTILSLSFDPAVEDVDNYRQKDWAMPWLHTFVEKGFKSDLAKRFEVSGIPEPILVGPEGKIIATAGKLRGTTLLKTLEEFLGK